jgi:hypothetical protein
MLAGCVSRERNDRSHQPKCKAMDKSRMRSKLAALSFTEKIKILERLRDRDKAIAAAGLKQKPEPQSARKPVKKN